MPVSLPGGKELLGKKHRPGGPFAQTLRVISAEGSGPGGGDPPDRPYKELTQAQSESAVPARPMKWKSPHGFCPEDPCPRAWHPVEEHLWVAPISIRFKHFPSFQASGFTGSHGSGVVDKKASRSGPL